MRLLRLAFALAISVAIAASGWTPTSAQQVKAGCQETDSGAGPSPQNVSPPLGGHRVTDEPKETVSGSFSESSSVLGSNQIQVNWTVLACADQPLPNGTTGSTSGSSDGTGFGWTTPPLPWNGPYGVSIKASGNSGTRTIVRTFTLVIPPATPTDVRAVSGGNGVTVGWDRNSEPDLVGYLVRRGGNNLDAVAADSGTGRVTYLDQTVTPGHWSYDVIAVRQGATSAPEDRTNSVPSAAADTTVDTPPATTTPPSSTTGQSGGASGSGSGGTSTGSSASSSGGSASAAGSPATAKTGTVDLSNFAALLDSGRKTAQAQADALADPGYKDTLPFQAGDEPAVAEVPEAGSKAPNQGLGQRVISDSGDRRRAFSYIAGAAVLFVMFLQVRVIRSEVERADLEATAPEEPADTDTDTDTAVLQDVVPVTASLIPAEREPDPDPEPLSPIEMDPEPSPPMIEVLGEPDREPEQPIVIAPIAPADAPHLDIPDPDTAAPRAPRTPTTRSPNAGRATRRVPPRPANDRGEGRAPVRARRGGAGSGDRRVPLG